MIQEAGRVHGSKVFVRYEKEDIVKETKPKRGRPKKEVATSQKKETKTKKEEKIVEEIKPKRGRPRKVAINND